MSSDLTRVIGIGNSLMGDDGLGIKAIELLQKQDLPESTELIDGGCGGLKLLPLLSDCKKLIIIDAADFSETAGRIKILNNTDLYRLPAPAFEQNGHHFSLPEILHAAQKLQQLRPLSLYLMQIKSCVPGTILSAEIRTALPILVESIIDTLQP